MKPDGPVVDGNVGKSATSTHLEPAVVEADLLRHPAGRHVRARAQRGEQQLERTLAPVLATPRLRLVADERRKVAHVDRTGGAAQHLRMCAVRDDVVLFLADLRHVQPLSPMEITSFFPGDASCRSQAAATSSSDSTSRST